MRKFTQTYELRKILVKLFKKDKTTYAQVLAKMQEILGCKNIQHYKNLRRPLQHLKRVHVGSFVLLFKYFSEEYSIEFITFRHHDEAYT